MTNKDREATVVHELMTSDPVSIHVSDSAGRARDLMSALRFHALPVTEGSRIVGIVTTTDLADNWPEDTPVTRLMSAAPHSISRDATLETAAAQMLANEVHHLVVDPGGEAPGILSSFDLLRALADRAPSS